MTPRQIAELIYAEFTPLSKMTIEQSIDHVEHLIAKSNSEAVVDWIKGNTVLASCNESLFEKAYLKPDHEHKNIP